MSCSQIAVNLSGGCRVKNQCGFGYDDQLFINNHVYALGAQVLAFIEDWNCNFSPNPMTAPEKLTLQRHNIKVFKKSEPEMIVNLKEHPNNRFGEIFLNELLTHWRRMLVSKRTPPSFRP